MDNLLTDWRNWRHHGLGMLQSKPFPDGSRIHFWAPDLVDLTLEAPIHTHRWELQSTVLFGQLVDELIQLKPFFNGQYVERYTANSESAAPRFESVQRYNVISTFHTYSAGDTYCVARDIYHCSHPTEFAITRIKRTGVSGFSKVLAPVGVVPKNGVCDIERNEHKIKQYHDVFISLWEQVMG